MRKNVEPHRGGLRSQGLPWGVDIQAERMGRNKEESLQDGPPIYVQ